MPKADNDKQLRRYGREADVLWGPWVLLMAKELGALITSGCKLCTGAVHGTDVGLPGRCCSALC